MLASDFSMIKLAYLPIYAADFSRHFSVHYHLPESFACLTAPRRPFIKGTDVGQPAPYRLSLEFTELDVQKAQALRRHFDHGAVIDEYHLKRG